MSNKTQLAVPGVYINIGSNVQASKFRQELNSEKYVINCPLSLLNCPAFEEDNITSKVGGLPNWLTPSNGIDSFVLPSIPNCTSCSKPLLLVSQLCAPFDFPSDTLQPPAPSTHSSHLGTRTRHTRTLYVFGCNTPSCANAPGSWVCLSLCKSVGVDVKPSSTAINTHNDSDNDGDLSSDEEDAEQEIVRAIKGLSIAPKAIEPVPAVVTVSSLSTKPTKPVKSGLFELSQWSDDDDDDNDTTTASTTTVTANEDLSNLSSLLDARDAHDKELEIRLNTHKEQEQARQRDIALKKQQNAREKVVVKDDDVTTSVFRPFYLCWLTEPGPTKTECAHADALLKQYMSEHGKGEVDEAEGGENGGNDGDLSEDEYEDTGDKVFRRLSNRIQRQPDQCIRYWPNKALKLHETPKGDEAVKLKKSVESHPMNAFKHISGVWSLHNVPDCEHCGTPMQLELQLMPNLLNELHVNEDEEDEVSNLQNPLYRGMDWGLVDVFICPMMCCPDEYVTNYCLIHPSL